MSEPVDPFLNPVLAATSAGTTNGGRFGCSRNGGNSFHDGTDLKADVGTAFVSIYAGTVQAIRDNVPNNVNTPNSVGNYVIIRSNQKQVSIKYCHLSEVSVQPGQAVAAGQELGKTGKSGNAFDDIQVPVKHLHIVVSTDYFLTSTKYVDPEPFLKTNYGANPNSPGPACP
ncbi:MAG: M23 family metallopeptidase [Chloracidobacterium sp.]|nr:M23 family metallopeptidase [Chloracidobacterium sp.]